MKTYKIPAKVEIDQDTLDGIIDSAINWCGYWCDAMVKGKAPVEEAPYTSEIITRGGTLVFKIDEPFEEGGKTRFVLTLNKMLKGLAKYGEYDWDQFDGPMADAALQQALFGEVIYG